MRCSALLHRQEPIHDRVVFSPFRCLYSELFPVHLNLSWHPLGEYFLNRGQFQT
ncbi:Uncharacterised protein [Vibrio cholerae]|nr:Uncharacterised protein [Vibrio cholerae]CSI43749.1 Uncharacterised protein [Vibrio cholerae]